MKRLVRASVALALVAAAGTAASPAQAARFHPPIVALNANQSSNWSGYNQGALEKGTTFNGITGDWTVPTATQHTARQDEYSSSWIGIGGGCVDANCNVGDTTLIQAGTEQDVSSSGSASYSAWWELIPAPSIQITSLTIHPGDHIHASIAETVPNSEVWNMQLTDVTTGQSWSQTVPCTSTHATAEWIEETPLVIDTSGAALSPMPNLSTVNFDVATANAANAGLTASEEMQLVDSSGRPVATPSSPDPDTDGFNDCTFAGSCPAPTSS